MKRMRAWLIVEVEPRRRCGYEDARALGLWLPDGIIPQADQSILLAADGLPARVSGDWIRRKHHYLDRCCDITATGMKNKFRERVFVDVMAGPGLCKIKDTGEEYPGSPLVAMIHG